MAKLKLSVTLPPDLVALVDRAAQAAPGSSRSAVIERWLRAASREEARRDLARATVEYYESLTAEERAEDEEWSRFSSAHVSWGDDAPSRAADVHAAGSVARPRRPRRKQ